MSYYVRSTTATWATASSDVFTSETFLADMNGDRKLDLVFAYSSSRNVSIPIRVMLGDGRGSFSDGTKAVFGNNVPSMIAPRDEAIVDFNGDGKPDIFFGDQGFDAAPFPGGVNALLLSNGATYTNVGSMQVPLRMDFTHTVAAADINGDGFVDIYVGNIYGQNNIAPYMLMNDGTGRFTLNTSRLPSIQNFDLGKFTSSTFFDVNGDGHPDLFLGTEGEVSSRVLINDGAGNFTKSFKVTTTPGSVIVDSASADLDGDGRTDIVVSSTTGYNGGGYIEILMNQGGTSLVDETAMRLYGFADGHVNSDTWIYRTILADMNSDGYTDIVTTSGGSSAASPIFYNDGSGHFTRVPVSLPGLGPYHLLAIGDVNGDGRQDIVMDLHGGGLQTEVVFLSKDIPHNQTGTGLNDGIVGTGGGNTIDGGAGDDTIAGVSGQNYLRGGDGNDMIVGGGNFDNINGNKGNDTCYGGAGNDWVVGGQDNDLLYGDNGNDIVYGNLGNDTLYGGNGDDWVRGGQGDDVIYGDAGNDFMSGDRGNDTIYGGAGADRFNLVSGAAIDRVMDFKASEGDYVTIEGNLKYTLSFVSGDATINIGNGDVMTLVGVSSQSLLGSGWLHAS